MPNTSFPPILDSKLLYSEAFTKFFFEDRYWHTVQRRLIIAILFWFITRERIYCDISLYKSGTHECNFAIIFLMLRSRSVKKTM